MSRLRAYALEHLGSETSFLYVSQVERKCGIEVKYKYNRAKKKTQKKVTIKEGAETFSNNLRCRHNQPHTEENVAQLAN